MSAGIRIFLLAGIFCLGQTQALAVSNQLLDGRALDVNQLEPNAASCDSVCGIVVSDLTKDLKGLDGGNGWRKSDDQWCADHGLSTNPTVLASPVPRASDAPAVPACNVALLSGDSNCQTVNRKMSHCKMHGSQLETQCLAYATAKEAKGSEKVVLGFDVAAAATCTTACVAQASGPYGEAIVKACNITGIVASGAELLENLTSKSSGMQKVVGGLGSIVGAGKIMGGVSAYGWSGNGGVNAQQATEHMRGAQSALQGAQDEAKKANDAFAALQKDPKATADAVKQAEQNATNANGALKEAQTGAKEALDEGANAKADQDKKKKQACYSAAIYGALTGVRAYSISQHNGTKGKACDSVQKLYANSLAPGFGGPNPTGSTTPAISTNTSGVSTSSNTQISGGVVRTVNAQLGDGTDYSSCVANPQCVNKALDQAGSSSAATDGGLLKNSGLSKLIPGVAASLPIDQMMKHLENGGTADQLIQSALQGSGGGFGSGVAALAKAAQVDGAKLGGGEASGSAYASGSMGGGRAGGSPRGDENPFKLFGQNDGNLGAQNGVNFDKGPALDGAEIGQDGDIFHSSFSGSIFEIVSHKITKARDRVEGLGYALPMNRSIAGQR